MHFDIMDLVVCESREVIKPDGRLRLNTMGAPLYDMAVRHAAQHILLGAMPVHDLMGKSVEPIVDGQINPQMNISDDVRRELQRAFTLPSLEITL